MYREFKRTTLWLVAYVAVLAGLALAHGGFSVGLGWCAASSLLAWLLLRQRRGWTALFLVMVCALSWGLWRGHIFTGHLGDYQQLFGQKVVLVVSANGDGIYGAHSQTSFMADHVRLPDGRQLAGKVSASGFGLNSVYAGDEVEVSGKLKPGYGAAQANLSYAKLEFIRHHPSLIAEIRRKFAAGMQSALPEPLASFAMGLLIGQRSNLPAYVKQDLLMVGLTHIIAVSGYNLTIILHATRGLLAKHSKRASLLLALGLIFGFWLLAGSSASITRAAIVSLLSIVATYYGRSFKPVNLITLAASVTAFANPFYLWSDVSWYLSFLAFWGVMIISPAISRRFNFKDSLVLQIALETWCAELMTLPIIIYVFGQLSVIGLLANVLVAALIPAAMFLSALAGLAGMATGLFAGWVAFPARLILTYMLDVAHLLAGIPHVFIQHLSLALPQMILLYAVLLSCSLALWFKSQKYDMITDRFNW